MWGGSGKNIPKGKTSNQVAQPTNKSSLPETFRKLDSQRVQLSIPSAEASHALEANIIVIGIIIIIIIIIIITITVIYMCIYIYIYVYIYTYKYIYI